MGAKREVGVCGGLMELWACGFNAWNQLAGEPGKDFSSSPQDILEFKCILQDRIIEDLRTCLSSTLIKTSSALKVTGYPDEFIRLCCENDPAALKVTLAGNNKLGVYNNEQQLIEYPSIEAYKTHNGRTLSHIKNIQQLESNQTTFTALTSSGAVYTWGDGRYPSCLARDISEDCPASTPHPVDDLLDLPTGKARKISSGGYVTAALTEGNDLYIWGGRPGQRKVLEQLEGTPTPVDLQGLDILDVAVGNDHVLALSVDYRLFVVGSGGNGQLGLGADVKELEDWREVVLALLEGQRIARVYAGYKTSFVVIEEVPA